MIEGLLGLLSCQLVGEVLVHVLGLRLPGPVLGMLILLVILTVRPPRADHPVLTAGNRVLEDLPLLFVPAGVGIMTSVALLRAQWLPISVSLVVSWLAALLVTAGVAHVVAKLPWAVRTAVHPTDEQSRVLVEESDRIEGLESGGQR